MGKAELNQHRDPRYLVYSFCGNWRPNFGTSLKAKIGCPSLFTSSIYTVLLATPTTGLEFGRAGLIKELSWDIILHGIIRPIGSGPPYMPWRFQRCHAIKSRSGPSFSHGGSAGQASGSKKSCVVSVRVKGRFCPSFGTRGVAHAAGLALLKQTRTTIV